jgi:uncharacterized phosphosugar-binding protein
MSLEIDRYFSSLQAKIVQLAQANAEALDQAADLCASALANKKIIHIYDTGHIISHELINRTGGLVAYTHLSFDGVLDNRNEKLERKNHETHFNSSLDIIPCKFAGLYAIILSKQLYVRHSIQS